MKEIKFRAWERSKKVMITSRSLSFEYHDGKTFGFAVGDLQHCFPVPKENIVLMQYTGLKDHNGTEIYEGDIVRIWGGEYWYGYWEVDIKGEVVFDMFSYGVKSEDRFYPFNIAFEAYDYQIKVIGNIYENPELLKGETK